MAENTEELLSDSDILFRNHIPIRKVYREQQEL